MRSTWQPVSWARQGRVRCLPPPRPSAGFAIPLRPNRCHLSRSRARPSPSSPWPLGRRATTRRQRAATACPSSAVTAELDALLGRASAVAGGTGSVVEIIGAPGIGKSRLVSEAIDRWSLDTLRVACEQYGSATPYLAFRHVFRRLLGGASDAANDIVVAELRRVVAAFLPDLEPFLPLLADVVDVSVPATREVDELEPRFRRTRPRAQCCAAHGAVHLGTFRIGARRCACHGRGLGELAQKSHPRTRHPAIARRSYPWT